MSNKNKATHSGSCQACGRIQKLPSGVLSQHGYHKTWGFFDGVCPGSGYLPFELSFDRVQVYADRVKLQIEAMKTRTVEMLLEPIDPAATTVTAPYYAYRGYRDKVNMYQATGHFETLANVTKDEKGEIWVSYDRGNGTFAKEAGFRHSLYGTLTEVVTKLRAQQAARDQAWIVERQKYVDWQEKRIAEWKPGKLTPVTPK